MNTVQSTRRDEPELGFEMQVPAHPASIGLVRRAAQAVQDVCGPSVAQALALVFTELVTNSIRHAGLGRTDTVQVSLDIAIGDGVRGRVRDHGEGFAPDPSGPKIHPDGGYGLKIVERLSQRWGVQRTEGWNEVWFELA